MMTRACVNLLPYSYRRRRLARRRLLEWSVVWLGCLSVGLAAWRIQREACAAARAGLVEIERGFEQVERLQLASARMRKKLGELGKHESLLGKLEALPAPLLSVGLASASARLCLGTVRVEKLRFEARRDAPPVPAAKGGQEPAAMPADESAGLLTIEGSGQNNLAVSQFVVGLRDTGGFRRVELKSAAGGAPGEAASKYLLECGL